MAAQRSGGGRIRTRDPGRALVVNAGTGNTMQYLAFLIILSVTTGTYLASIHAAPPLLKYLPEALSILVAAYVAVLGPQSRFRLVAPKYWIVFIAIAVVIGCGILINSVAPGPLMQGCRFYLRAIPLFFLPAVFAFSESQIRAQLRLLLGIAFLQLPLSVYQRHEVFAAGRFTGDPVFGTLMAAICLAAAEVLRGRMSKLAFFCLFVLFVIPTTINETKGTIFLLPIGLLLTLLVGSEPGTRLKVGVSAIALLSVFGALFVPIYDYFSTANNPYPYTLESFFGNRRNVVRYVNTGGDIGTRSNEVGRIDALVVPAQQLSSDPVRLMLGVGMGNTAISTMLGGADYSGAYASLYGRYAEVSTAAEFLVEIGVIGLVLVFQLYWLIFRDAMAVAAQDTGLMGSIALGWVGVTAVIAVATFYKGITGFESLSYLFWYFSGLIAAMRMRLLTTGVVARTPLRGSPASKRSLARGRGARTEPSNGRFKN
jgi:hypothetical protein